MINSNSVETLRQSLESVLTQLDENFEVVVVDNVSSDGSREILEDFERKGNIRLVIQKCSRGLGRQIAFEQSRGRYVVLNVDTDCLYKPMIPRLLEIYRNRFPDTCMLMHGFAICTRGLVNQVGGYRDLQFSEDSDLYARCARVGKLRYLDFETRYAMRQEGSGSIAHRMVYKFQRARDLYSLGLNPTRSLSSSRWKRWFLQRPIIGLGYIAHFFETDLSNPALDGFNPWNYQVQLPTELKLIAASAKGTFNEDNVGVMSFRP